MYSSRFFLNPTFIAPAALISKLKYNGMTVGKIGKMRDYLRDEISYIKGQLIRIELNEDFNYLNEIANEIIKGVYI